MMLVTVPGARPFALTTYDEPANVTHIDLVRGQVRQRRNDVLVRPLPVKRHRSRRVASLRVTMRGATLEVRDPLLRKVGQLPTDALGVLAVVNKSPALAGLSEGGRYWARTSDPQLVELVLSQLS